MEPIVEPKYIFKSKTAIASLLVAAAGALGTWSEPAGQFLSAHAGVILMVIGAAGLLLRKITSGKVYLYK